MSYKKFVRRPSTSAKTTLLETKLRQLRKKRIDLRTSVGSAEVIMRNRKISALPTLVLDGIF